MIFVKQHFFIQHKFLSHKIEMSHSYKGIIRPKYEGQSKITELYLIIVKLHIVDKIVIIFYKYDIS